MRPAQQTIAQLLAFLDSADLAPVVKAAAQLEITHPEWTFAVLADQTGAKATSTASQPVQEGQDIALAAGFSIPPLPDLGETLAGKGVVDVDAIPFRACAELVVR